MNEPKRLARRSEGWYRANVSKEKEIRLERRPEARSFTIERLLLAVRDGKIRVPEFQRPLRWKSSDVLDFFDSVHRGFPVGTLLLSRAPAPEATLHFGSYVVRAKKMTDALYVVDGQQRITALAAAILHPDRFPRDGIFAVWFDLEHERFVRLTKSSPPLTWIPLNIAGNRKATLKWLTEWPLRSERPDLEDRVFGLNTNLESFEIPAYVVEQASPDALRTIFKRTNTSGVELKESEVFEALYGAKRVRPISSAIVRLQEQTKFGGLDPEWFLRCLKSIENIDPRRTFNDEEENGASMEAAVEKTEIALRHAVTFLMEDGGIPHIQLLPYRLPLIVLSRLFSRHPEVDSRARRLLVRWVWRGALSGTHTDSNNAVVNELQTRIDDDLYASIGRLLQGVPSQIRATRSYELKLNGRAALFKLYVLALLHKSPRDPETGEPLTLIQMADLLEQQGELKKMIIEVGSTSQATLASRVLLARKESVRALAGASEQILLSHLIDEKAARDLRRGDFEAFAKKRAKLIDEWAQSFFAVQAGVGENDRPSLAEIARRVESLALSA